MKFVSHKLTPRLLVHIGTILFSASIALAYALYPHWVTMSHFAEHWYTLIPFVVAMLIAMLELAYIATQLHHHGGVVTGANAFYASAAFIALVICIPYLGSATQKDLHNLVALLFALSAAFGFVMVAKGLRNYVIGTLSGAIFIICLLELVFLARYKAHPVYTWVWTVLELAATAALIIGLDAIAVIIGRNRTGQLEVEAS
jgi:hypothetical protein